MKLLQFSTPTCPPCRLSLEYITKRFPNHPDYVYLDITKSENIINNMDILKKSMGTGVPLFVLIDETRKIVDHWLGYNPKKISDVLSGLQTSS